MNIIIFNQRNMLKAGTQAFTNMIKYYCVNNKIYLVVPKHRKDDYECNFKHRNLTIIRYSSISTLI